jgi:hypothetical protein
MKDANLTALLTAKRLVERRAEYTQLEDSAKIVAVPQHAFEALMEAVHNVLLEEVEKGG